MKFDKLVTGVLIVAVVILGIRGECKNNKIEGLENEIMSMALQSPETLPDDIVTTAILNKHILTAMSRVDGDSVIVETHYVPVESEVQYIVRTDTLAMGELEQAQIALAYLRENMYTEEDSARVVELELSISNLQRMLYTIEVDYDTHGWCFEPALEVGGDSNLDLGFGGALRLYYLGRWGIGIKASVTRNEEASVGIYGDYRIRGWENVAPFGSLQYDFMNEQIKGAIGLHFYLR